MSTERASAVLCAISSLPSKFGIGCFDEAAYQFVDWLVAAKQSIWQILPLGHSGKSASPYKCYSAFAGHPFYIDLSPFIEDGVLTAEECEACAGKANEHVDYERLRKHRMPLLRKVYEASDICGTPAFKAFVNGNSWVEPYAQFMALKSSLDNVKLQDWPKELRVYESDAVLAACEKLADDVLFYEFLQYVFFQQWRRLKKYANERGVQILGDIPIYVSDDSADLWVSPELFQTAPDGSLANIAGCPPDAFSANGQVWGNPLYDWPVHEQEGFSWWINRMRSCFELFDIVRIDHFRGFESYYAIDANTLDAALGHWEQGPGIALFDALRGAFGERDIVVEDLGTITDAVRELVKETGFSNMRILEFGFDARNEGDRTFYLPHSYPVNCVAYTGTHDNETLQEWLTAITPAEHDLVRAYLCDEDKTLDAKLNDALIALIMRSAARLTVVPLQDWLGLGKEARMNIPSTVNDKNWAWRVTTAQLSKELGEKIARMTSDFGRTSRS